MLFVEGQRKENQNDSCRARRLNGIENKQPVYFFEQL